MWSEHVRGHGQHREIPSVDLDVGDDTVNYVLEFGIAVLIMLFIILVVLVKSLAKKLFLSLPLKPRLMAIS